MSGRHSKEGSASGRAAAVAQSPMLKTTLTISRLKRRGYESMLDYYSTFKTFDSMNCDRTVACDQRPQKDAEVRKPRPTDLGIDA